MTTSPRTDSISPLFAPWELLAQDASSVIGLRLMALPWQMAFAPHKGRSEVRLMVSEKKAALAETQIALMMAPVNFWMSFVMNVFLVGPMKATDTALEQANAAIIGPSRKRVRSNLRRLR